MTPHIMSRLTKLVERALDPDGGAESHSALDAIHRWMKRNKKDTAWLLANVGKQALVDAPIKGDWVGQLDWLAERPKYLNDRELEFIMRTRREGKIPSLRQMRKIGAIYEVVRMVAYQQ